MENSILEIESQIRSIKEMCHEHIAFLEEAEDKALMTAAAEVLNGLEHAFHSCFHDQNQDHVFSPKSSEPWD